MNRFCLVSYPGQERSPEVVKIKTLPDLLKAHPEGLYRLTYFVETDNLQEIREAGSKGRLPMGGPFSVVHAVRRASDIVLEECGYENHTFTLEVGGKRLPELPSKGDIEALLKEEKTLVVFDSRTYKPNTEVFSFQDVYDDTIRFIAALKKLGITSDQMGIYATPEEISIEVHPGVFDIPDDPKLPLYYQNLLFKLAGVKRMDRRFQKTFNRTVLLQTPQFTHQFLIPGSIHPGLRRPKVCVGQTHISYGIAAFSDFCGKKRSLEECQQETKNWVKFLESSVIAVDGLRDILTEVSVTETPAVVPVSAPVEKAPSVSATGGVRPLHEELAAISSQPPSSQPSIPAPWPEFTRLLLGGWKKDGLHVIFGGREEGKAAFLLAQALNLASKAGVLFVSREQHPREFVQRVASWASRVSIAEIAFKSGASSPDGEASRRKYKEILDASRPFLGDSFFFRGIDSVLRFGDVDELGQMMKMISQKETRALFLESWRLEDIPRGSDLLDRLKGLASGQGFPVFLSVHVPPVAYPKPHFIDGFDLEILDRWQGVADTIIHLSSERINLRKFLAMSQGKVDPAIAEKLEQKLYHAAGAGKLKGDTFSLARIIHQRGGGRYAASFLYQRDIQRFTEGLSMALGRP